MTAAPPVSSRLRSPLIFSWQALTSSSSSQQKERDKWQWASVTILIDCISKPLPAPSTIIFSFKGKNQRTDNFSASLHNLCCLLGSPLDIGLCSKVHNLETKRSGSDQCQPEVFYITHHNITSNSKLAGHSQLWQLG